MYISNKITGNKIQTYKVDWKLVFYSLSMIVSFNVEEKKYESKNLLCNLKWNNEEMCTRRAFKNVSIMNINISLFTFLYIHITLSYKSQMKFWLFNHILNFCEAINFFLKFLIPKNVFKNKYIFQFYLTELSCICHNIILMSNEFCVKWDLGNIFTFFN